MDNLTMWNFIVSFFTPLAVSAITQPEWDKRTKVLVMIGVSVVAGFGTTWLAGDLNGKDLVSSILLIIFATIAAYKGIFKPTGIAPAVEEITSPSSREPKHLADDDMRG